MKSLFTVIILSAILLAAAFLAIAVKIVVKKDGEFKRHCANTDPYTGERNGCICGKTVAEQCSKKEHSPLEINREFLDEC